MILSDILNNIHIALILNGKSHNFCGYVLGFGENEKEMLGRGSKTKKESTLAF